MMRQKWLTILGVNEHKKLNPRWVVCSTHFPETCFLPQSDKKKRRILKVSAVPTIFLDKLNFKYDADGNNSENNPNGKNINYILNQSKISLEIKEREVPVLNCASGIYVEKTDSCDYQEIGAYCEVPFAVEVECNDDNTYGPSISSDFTISAQNLENSVSNYTSFKAGSLPQIDERPELLLDTNNIPQPIPNFQSSQILQYNLSDLDKSPTQNTPNIIATSFGSGSSIGSSGSSFVSKIIRSSYFNKKWNKITINRAMETTGADLSTSPRQELRIQKLRFLRKKYSNLNKKNKSLRQKVYRQKQIIRTLGHLLDELEDKNLITSCQKDKFLDFTNPKFCFINRYIDKVSDRKLARQYPEEIKKFALNLNFYSPKAYEYVRKQFNNCLPHSRTIGNWYKVVDGNPGFTLEAFRTLEALVRSKKEKGESVIGNLCLDEMYIHPKYEYDFNKKKIWGYVEFPGSDPDDNTLATQVIVFMFVCCNGSWKMPIGYFPIQSLTSHNKRNMIECCLRLLYDIGIITIGVTFDGLSTNFTLVRELGCDVSVPSMNMTFQVQQIPHKFLVFFDPCHMFKLIRNTLFSKGPFIDSKGNIISWKYLEELHKIQDEEGFHLGNKLRKAHIYFINQKMKVNLAVQTLSNSVANALEFCDSTLKLKKFEGCGATIKFIRIFNNLFDILNSKTFKDYGFKKPISTSNFIFIQNNIKTAIEYISELKFLSDGNKIIYSKSKTGFIGVIGCLNNIQVLHDDYLLTKRLKYVSFYKLSQDHVELFFSIIRSRLGRNTNPTLKQFVTSYKRILTHVQLSNASIGNCIPQTEISILNVSNGNSDWLINSSINRSAMLECSSSMDVEPVVAHSDKEDPSLYDGDNFLGYPIILSEFSINVIEYIGGFIVRYLFKKLNCEDCYKLLQQTNVRASLINLKNKGGLITPSPSVLKICKYTEAVLKRELTITDYRNMTQLQSNLKFFKKVCYNVLQNLLDENLFIDNEKYQYNHSQEHLHLLSQSIVEKYYDIRMNYFCNEKSKKLTKRNRFISLLHFQGM